MTAPTDTTVSEWISLRPLGAADAPAVQVLCDNWNVARWTARLPFPYTLDDARAWIAGDREAADEHRFAVVRGNDLVGAVGLVPGDGAAELGYWIGEPYWGHGYATWAARAAIAHAVRALDLRRLTAGHFEGNAASARVLAKCGFVQTGRTLLYSVARGEEVPSLRLELSGSALAATASEPGQ